MRGLGPPPPARRGRGRRRRRQARAADLDAVRRREDERAGVLDGAAVDAHAALERLFPAEAVEAVGDVAVERTREGCERLGGVLFDEF